MYLRISHNLYRNVNMTMVCQYAPYRDYNSFRSHRWDLALPLVHPQMPRMGSVVLKMNDFDVMILQFVKRTGEKDKENRQLGDSLDPQLDVLKYYDNHSAKC